MPLAYVGKKTNINEYLLSNRDYYDVEIETIDKKIIKAHKLFLASKIEYFNNLFKMEKKDKYEIVTTYSVFNEVVKFAYSNRFEFKSLSDFIECLLFADQIVYTELFDQLLVSLDPDFICNSELKVISDKLTNLSISTNKKISDKNKELLVHIFSHKQKFSAINKILKDTDLTVCYYGDIASCSTYFENIDMPNVLAKFSIEKIYIVPHTVEYISVTGKSTSVKSINFKFYVDKKMILKNYPWITVHNFDKIFEKSIKHKNVECYVFGSNKREFLSGYNMCNDYIQYLHCLIDVNNVFVKEISSSINYSRCKKFIKWHMKNVKDREYNDIVNEFDL